MKTKILMVCLGNICRSPLAEGILQSKLDPSNFLVDSCGTGAYHIGEKPDRRSIAIAKLNGIDITHQKAMQFKNAFFDEYDHIYTMDSSNYENIIKLTVSQEHKNKVSLIMNELLPDTNTEVPDPYYGGDQGFENVFQMLDEACNVIANKLQNTI